MIFLTDVLILPSMDSELLVTHVLYMFQVARYVCPSVLSSTV